MSYFSDKLSTILEYGDILFEAISDDVLIKSLKASTAMIYTQDIETLRNSPSFANRILQGMGGFSSDPTSVVNTFDEWLAQTSWPRADNDVPEIKGLVQIGELPEEKLLAILEYIKSNIRSVRKRRPEKFLRYWVDQVAKGNFRRINSQATLANREAMLGPNFEHDSIRLSNTIDRFNKVKGKSSWTDSANLYDHGDWRELEKTLTNFNITVEDEKGNTHSMVLYTEELSLGGSNAELMAQILELGSEIEKMPTKKYWLRQIFTPEAAQKYGRGTQWCTTNPTTAASYLKRNPIFIIETSGGQYRDYNAKEVRTSRRPILQICDREVMGKTDAPVGRVGNLLARFVKNALDALGIGQTAWENPDQIAWTAEYSDGSRSSEPQSLPDYKKHPGLNGDAFATLSKLISSSRYEPAPFQEARRFEYRADDFGNAVKTDNYPATKFWTMNPMSLNNDGTTLVTINYGRIGTNGRTHTKTFASSVEAKRHIDKIIRSKLQKGYVEVS